MDDNGWPIAFVRVSTVLQYEQTLPFFRNAGFGIFTFPLMEAIGLLGVGILFYLWYTKLFAYFITQHIANLNVPWYRTFFSCYLIYEN